MSGTTISSLPVASSMTLADSLAVVQHGTPNVTKQGTLGTLFAVLNGATIEGPFGVTNPGTASVEVVNFDQFNPTAASPGVITYPGGVTDQWGTATTSGAFGTATITFSPAFSGAPWEVRAQAYGFATTQAIGVNISGTPTATTATFYAFNATNGVPVAGIQFFWSARGPT